MDSIANNYHWLRSLLSGTVLFMMAALVLASCSSSGGGGGGADLVIEPTVEGWNFQVTASVSSTNLGIGDTFTLTAMVTNASSASEPTTASMLSYYQSIDAIIDSNDTLLNTDPVASLAVGASDTYSIDPTAPTTAGTYYYGACMPATGNELDASDNCSAEVAVTVTGGWDFQVTASANSVVGAGDSFTLTAVVTNASGASVPTTASTLSYYQSSDAAIDASDTSLGTDPVAILAVGESFTESFNATAPTTAGTYYYGACIPATGSELDASDNCSAGVAVTVTSGWDFQVTAMVSSASVTGSTPFTLTAEVSNTSGASGPTPTSTLTYYQSSDATISSSDTELGTDPVASLTAGTSSSHSRDLTNTSASGTYYYGACMPATSGETDATDNCSSGVVVMVTSGWDYQVTALASSTLLGGSASFTLTAEVSNAGIANQATSASTLTYYQSNDATISASDTSLGTDPVASLAVGASGTYSKNLTTLTTAGTYYYGACMPATGSELVATDNCSAGVAVTVSGWDFQVTEAANVSSVEVGGSFKLTAIVSNAASATEPTPESTLTYYLDSNGFTSIGTEIVPSLVVGGFSNHDRVVTAPATAGSYSYTVCMPITGRELVPIDNCGNLVTITVTASAGG